jgi:hypothetical protein
MSKIPNRGEVWLVDLGYVAKVRPCLVISISVQMKREASYGDRFTELIHFVRQ